MCNVSQLREATSAQWSYRESKRGSYRMLASTFVLVSLLMTIPIRTEAAATLEGEVFSSIDINASAVRCDPKIGEIAFTISGSATGPYVGTFTEEGFIDFDPATGIISSVEISFRIVDKSSGVVIVVDGTKHLNDNTRASCVVNSDIGTTEFSVSVQLSYSSTVDIGDATLDLKGVVVNKSGALKALSFNEVFHTSKILPRSLGKITGGGTILKTSDNLGVNFGFNAQSTEKGMKGSGVIVDHASGKTVKIIDVTYLGVAGTQAVFLGNAEVNGILEEYRIDIDDLGEPGIGIDAFSIITNSYRTEGILTGGNVQIHK